MTTPTTPAAAVSLDDLAGQLLECIADTPWLTCNVAKSVVRSAAEELRIATARESALIAERDALLIAGDDLANCAYNLAQRSGEVLSARSAVALDNARRKWDAALSAPAVEGV